MKAALRRLRDAICRVIAVLEKLEESDRSSIPERAGRKRSRESDVLPSNKRHVSRIRPDQQSDPSKQKRKESFNGIPGTMRITRPFERKAQIESKKRVKEALYCNNEETKTIIHVENPRSQKTLRARVSGLGSGSLTSREAVTHDRSATSTFTTSTLTRDSRQWISMKEEESSEENPSSKEVTPPNSSISSSENFANAPTHTDHGAQTQIRTEEYKIHRQTKNESWRTPIGGVQNNKQAKRCWFCTKVFRQMEPCTQTTMAGGEIRPLCSLCHKGYTQNSPMNRGCPQKLLVQSKSSSSSLVVSLMDTF